MLNGFLNPFSIIVVLLATLLVVLWVPADEAVVVAPPIMVDGIRVPAASDDRSVSCSMLFISVVALQTLGSSWTLLWLLSVFGPVSSGDLVVVTGFDDGRSELWLSSDALPGVGSPGQFVRGLIGLGTALLALGLGDTVDPAAAYGWMPTGPILCGVIGAPSRLCALSAVGPAGWWERGP